MLRNVLNVRITTIGTFLLKPHSRCVKRRIPHKWTVPPKFTSSARRINALVTVFIWNVHCCESSQAIDTKLKCIKENEKNIACIIIQSDEYYKVGKYEESYNVLKDFEKTENAEILWRLARCLYDMSKQSGLKTYEKVQMIDEAYKIITRAMELDYKNYAVHKWTAILLDAKNSLAGLEAKIKGLHDFKKHLLYAMELNPKDATTIYILGQYCYNIAGMTWYQKKIATAFFGTLPEATYEEALHFFSKAEEVEPNFYSLNLLMLGKTYLQLNKSEAARYWLKCASTYPMRTEEDKQVRKEAEELLKNIPE